ncbi:putative reverse transcriptase domain-containing protein [Tanacetum coccineum]
MAQREPQGEPPGHTNQIAKNPPAKLLLRMFPEEIDKIEKYIGGLPDMIHGSVKASKPKTMQESIEFTTELMDEKTHAYAERQTERKRKYNDLSKNNQNQQQQNKRQNTGQDCRSRPANANNNNRNNNNNNQKGNGCYECGAQGHFRRNCPKLRNNDRGNQSGNDRAPAKVYVVGNAGANPDNVVAEEEENFDNVFIPCLGLSLFYQFKGFLQTLDMMWTFMGQEILPVVGLDFFFEIVILRMQFYVHLFKMSVFAGALAMYILLLHRRCTG